MKRWNTRPGRLRQATYSIGDELIVYTLDSPNCLTSRRGQATQLLQSRKEKDKGDASDGAVAEVTDLRPWILICLLLGDLCVK